MGVKKSLPYTCMVEGKITQMRTAKVPDGVDAGRVSFEQGDACNLRADLGSFDAVLAGNLLCRLPDPKGFLQVCTVAFNCLPSTVCPLLFAPLLFALYCLPSNV
jgi:hypothetical protein